jgi:PAS domain S-box-containing protein
MSDRPPIRVLLVEDNPTDVLLLREALAETPSIEFVLTQVERLADGLARLREEPFDVVLLDLGLPDSSGADTLVRLHRQEPDVPVLVLTGLKDEAVGLQTLQEGAQDYLVKNQLPASLLGRSIQYAIERHRVAAALRESEMRLAGIIGSAMDGIITVDEQQRITLFNAAAERIFGCRAAEMLGQPLDRLIPERFHAAHAEYIRTFGQTNVTRRTMGELGIIYGRRADGEEFPMEASISQIEVRGRKLFTVIHRDITERQRAEAALRESEERLRLFIEHAPAALAMFDREMRYLYVSHRWLSDYGLGERDLRGLSHYTVFSEIPERWKAIHHRALAGEVVKADVDWFDRADGTVQWLRREVRPWHNAAGEVSGIVVFSEDITARRQAEEALRESEERLRLALDATDLGTWRHNPVTGMIHFDARARTHYGFDTAAVPLADLIARVHPDDAARLQQTIAAALDPMIGDGHYAAEYRVIHPGGTVRWVSVQAHVYFEGEGAARRSVLRVGTSQDITARKRAEESQLRSQKLEALGTLAGGIAHDFNNILLAIIGNTELAMADLPPQHPAQESLAEIAKASERAAQLVQRILTFSRPRDQKREIVQLQPIVDEALQLLRATLPAMIEMCTEFVPTVPAVATDATQIHQVIVNLATNAAHAIGPRGGLIEFRLDAMHVSAGLASTSPGLREGHYTRLSVSDNGCGMDQATLERIFDPFFTTKPAGQGTGLGLSVVHGIMQSHGGAVTVYSQPGQGSTFRLYFPAAEGAVSTTAAPPPEAARGRGERVLYIDDEEALVFLATRLLERLGYTVTGYTDPAAALQAFRSHPGDFDVVVTDLSMPGMSGFELARELLTLRPDVPILMTSGYVRPEDEEAALQRGIRALILKPTTIEELGRTLDRLFQDL